MPYDKKVVSDTGKMMDPTQASIGCDAYKGFPSILWAGDLDGDGKLDFVIIASGNGDTEEGQKAELYLSSVASTGMIVKKAAELVFGGS